MTSAETASLITRFRMTGKPAYREMVVVAHLPLAASRARPWANRNYKRSMTEDLFQVACVGLIEAIDRFDPDRGAFSTYACARISGAIRHFVRDTMPLMRSPRKAQGSIHVVSIDTENAETINPFIAYVEEGYALIEQQEYIYSILKRLPAESRKTIELLVQGYTIAQVAMLLDRAPRTIHRYVQKAVRYVDDLRTHVSAEGQNRLEASRSFPDR